MAAQTKFVYSEQFTHPDFLKRLITAYPPGPTSVNELAIYPVTTTIVTPRNDKPLLCLMQHNMKVQLPPHSGTEHLHSSWYELYVGSGGVCDMNNVCVLNLEFKVRLGARLNPDIMFTRHGGQVGYHHGTFVSVGRQLFVRMASGSFASFQTGEFASDERLRELVRDHADSFIVNEVKCIVT